MSNYIYAGMTTPHWNEIDYIHIGSYSDLINNIENDGILVGRYVLIKYNNLAYDVTTKNEIKKELSSETGSDDNTETSELNVEAGDDDTETTIDPKTQWKENYMADDKIDYDGVVCKKVITEEGLTYQPIVNLNTSVSADLIAGTQFDNYYNKTEINAKLTWQTF